MFRIDSNGAVAALPTIEVAEESPGYFSAGDPGSGQVATQVTAGWLNHIQEEIANAIEKKGLTLDRTDKNLLNKAIRRKRIKRLTSANNNEVVSDDYDIYELDASSGSLNVIMPALSSYQGREWRFVAISVANAITITRAGSDTFYSGQTSLSLDDVNQKIEIYGSAEAWR